jgi:hypothetical protein
MSRLVDFYRGEASDDQRRRLEDLWAWGDEQWEDVHDFIQWLFPLPEASGFNFYAPMLTDEDIATFRGDERLRVNVRRSFGRFLAFVGLVLNENGQVVAGPWRPRASRAARRDDGGASSPAHGPRR